jgi:Peptidase family M20/M25/M40
MSGAKAVREDRLWQRHADMAKLGGTPKGGVNRQALSAEDAAARNLLASWVRAKAQTLGLSHMDMPSGAGHDAMHVATLCPAGMIFVPCERGISHNESENATPGDLAAGTRVLVEVLVELANR